MTQAVSITITQNTFGVIAVMFVLAAVAAAFVAFVTGFVMFSQIDSGGRMSDVVSMLRWPAVVLAAVLGAWLGYVLMN